MERRHTELESALPWTGTKNKDAVCAEAEALLTKAPREGQQGRATGRPHRTPATRHVPEEL